MRLKIMQVGEPALRVLAQPLTPEQIVSDEIQRLITDMRETMRDAPGVGLAAPQVGVSVQLAVIEDREDYQRDLSPVQREERERTPVPFHVIVNPKIKATTDQKVEFFEGCLSLSGFSAVVPRARSVRVDCLDETGQARIIDASGWYARILQHEIDHLRGNLYIDRMNSRTFLSLDNWSRSWKGKSVAEVQLAVGAGNLSNEE